MRVLKDGKFWAGVVAGYLVLVLFPQFNIRTMSGKPGKGA